jgi:hypothetical protein
MTLDEAASRATEYLNATQRVPCGVITMTGREWRKRFWLFAWNSSEAIASAGKRGRIDGTGFVVVDAETLEVFCLKRGEDERVLGKRMAPPPLALCPTHRTPLPIEEVFVDGREIMDRDRALRIQVRTLGELLLPSGQLVACDPFFRNALTFARHVPPGEHIVQVAVADFADNRDQRVVLARLCISDCNVVRWENAAPEGSDVRSLPIGHHYGYGVDSGTGCFASAELAPSFAAEQTFCRALDAEMEAHTVDTWSWGTLRDPGGASNLIAFSSGFGDGFYPSYWGLDESGAIACLVTDFEVLLTST